MSEKYNSFASRYLEYYNNIISNDRVKEHHLRTANPTNSIKILFPSQ